MSSGSWGTQATMPTRACPCCLCRGPRLLHPVSLVVFFISKRLGSCGLLPGMLSGKRMSEEAWLVGGWAGRVLGVARTFVSYSLARGSEGGSSGWEAIPDTPPVPLWTPSPRWLFLPSSGSPTALSPLEPSRLSTEGVLSQGLHEARTCPRYPHFGDGTGICITCSWLPRWG